jgi:hypothetical protein
MHKVVKRPFLTSRTIAWRLAPLIWAASACETHCSGASFFAADGRAQLARIRYPVHPPALVDFGH